MNIPVSIKIPVLWGESVFTKNDWAGLNYLVGPNASGKTRFAEDLRPLLTQAGLSVRYLSAERLTGLERNQNAWGYGTPLNRGFDVGNFEQDKRYGEQQGLAGDGFITLRERLNVRIKVEAFLSSLFGRRIRLAEEGGFLKPKMQRILGGSEYSMKESECHGLKELISVLAFFYDDKYNTLIIDEPELHLHPQFQTFLLAAARRLSGDPRQEPGSKCFFIITHSPYFLDIRTITELRNCILFQPGRPPTSIESLNSQDEYLLKRLLPRLNTHHKQFFFSTRPIFVEGYTDQQLFTLTQESRGKIMGATSACFIDVGGKDEQDVFFRLCRRLNMDAQFISDLDVLTQGRFRDSISDDPRCQEFVTTAGIATDLKEAINHLVNKLDTLAAVIQATQAPQLAELQNALERANSDTHKKRYRILAAVVNQSSALASLPPESTSQVEYIKGTISQIPRACAAAGVHVLPRGVLENHLPSYTGSIYVVPEEAKVKQFEAEQNWLMNSPSSSEVESRYPDLIPLLDAASGSCDVDLRKHLSYSIRELIGAIQRAFARGEIKSAEDLMGHAEVGWTIYSRIVDLLSFEPDGRSFRCKMQLKSIVDPSKVCFEFGDETNHAKFDIQ